MTLEEESDEVDRLYVVERVDQLATMAGVAQMQAEPLLAGRPPTMAQFLALDAVIVGLADVISAITNAMDSIDPGAGE
jgi:hypothetical protein